MAAMPARYAEELVEPSYKWIGEKQTIVDRRGSPISMFPAGLGFSERGGGADKVQVRIRFTITRQDGTTETYLTDAEGCGEWGERHRRWQTSRLPVFAYESPHGNMSCAVFSYNVIQAGKVMPSRYQDRFATLDDFFRGRVASDDFHDLQLRQENEETLLPQEDSPAQSACSRINDTEAPPEIRPFFTRGDVGRPDHPVREIHRAIDLVIERKLLDPSGRHRVRFAVYDLDNDDVSKHLVFAAQQGVEIECIADWAQISPLNPSENIARLRRAGIGVYGVIRNDPCRIQYDLASMHTKFMLFDDDMVHSGSYNLHFHLWGGNWENGVTYRSRDVSAVFDAIYRVIRYGGTMKLETEPADAHNIYYSFGDYWAAGRPFRTQDAILTEIARARESITVCMFDLSDIRGRALGEREETDIIDALIGARDRGVKVRLLLNGMMAHTGKLPEAWDKTYRRPLKAAIRRLKDAWIEVFSVYYHESIYSPLHHKFAIVDHKTVITGSCNWYHPSLCSDEIVTVTRHERIAAAFREEAELILGSFRVERE